MIKTNVYLYQYENITLDVQDFFSNYRLDKLSTLRSKNIQTEYIVKISLEHFLDKKVDKLKFKTTENGKPIIDIENIYLNISHSNDYLAVVISTNEVAVDLELINIRHLKIAKKITNDFDKLDINDVTKMWTIKESYLKYFGMSILSNLKEITFDTNFVFGPKGNLNYQTKRYQDYYLTITLKDNSNISYYCLKDLKSVDEFNIINKSFEEEE
ncbi:MAG TPA: 4'-phosphopantetheinyl transferase superfamily protein [Haploplasma sp.]|nr:4'-phosphopantetheinyl transferase superfamily protein [Haploplasma sp.]